MVHRVIEATTVLLSKEGTEENGSTVNAPRTVHEGNELINVALQSCVFVTQWKHTLE